MMGTTFDNKSSTPEIHAIPYPKKTKNGWERVALPPLRERRTI